MLEAVLAAWLAIVPGTSPVPAECSSAGGDAATAFLVAANDARRERSLSPLALNGALCAVAADRARALAAAGHLDESLPAINELTHALARRGYRAYSYHEQPVLSGGDAAKVFAGLRRRDPADFADAVMGDVSDLGVGRAELAGTPLWVLLTALPAHTVFLRQAEALGDLESVRAAVLAAMNRERERVGRRALRRHPALERAAQLHAEDERRRGYYDHRSPTGTMPRARILAQGYNARIAGENLAKGFFTPEETVRRWMLSPHHRAQILDRQLVDVGIGWALDADGETAYWVADFAAGGPPP